MAKTLLCYRNRADTATLSAGSYSASLPRDNLKHQNVTKWARTSSAARANTRFRVDLGSVRSLRAAGLWHHNLTQHARFRARLGLAPMDIDFTSGVLDERITAAGGVGGTVFNSNGVMVAASAGRFDHDPTEYENGFVKSDSMTLPQWFTAGGGRLYGDGNTAALPVSGILVQLLNGVIAGNDYTVSAEVRVVSGDGQFQFRMNDGVTVVISAIQTATSEWQRFSGTLTATATTSSGNSGVVKVGAEGVLQFRNWQFESGSSASAYRHNPGTTRMYRCLGLLVEDPRTNLLLRSAEFDNATWAKTAVAVTANGSLAPDGATAMDFVKEDNTNSFHQLAQSVTYGVSSYYCLTAFVKIGVGTRRVQLIHNLTAGGFAQATFQVSAAGVWSVVSTSAGGANVWTSLSADVQNCGGGIYRLIFVSNSPPVAGAGSVLIRIDNGSGAAYLGDNASGHYLWGADLQNGLVPTSHIPTTSATVTRTVDTAAMTGGNFTSWCTTTSGTLYFEGSPAYDSAGLTTPVGIELSDGTANNRIALYSASSDDRSYCLVVTGGVTVASLANATGTITYGTPYKAALSYTFDDFAYSRDGQAVTTDTSGTMPVVTRADIGCTGTGGSRLNGHARRIAWWPFASTASQVVATTANGPEAMGGYDSGWQSALQMLFRDDVPSDWGKRGYGVAASFDEKVVRYGTIEILDEANADGYVQIGRLFLGDGLHFDAEASQDGYQDMREDRSTIFMTESGKEFSNTRRRQKGAAINFPIVSLTEGDRVHEMQDYCGVTEEVWFVPDQNDSAVSQRYGMLAKMAQLTPLDYPFYSNRSIGFVLREKL